MLWRAVRTLASVSKTLGRPLHVLIYTGDVGVSPEDVLSGVSRQFQITIDRSDLPVSFVCVRGRGLLDPGRYPVLTMLAQSLGSMVLAAEALVRATPDVFIDTTGFAFSFPVAWLAGCSVGAYVHYPTISTVSRVSYCSSLQHTTYCTVVGCTKILVSHTEAPSRLLSTINTSILLLLYKCRA